jgi:hypothetical protein
MGAVERRIFIERKRAGRQRQEVGVDALASIGQVRHQYYARARQIHLIDQGSTDIYKDISDLMAAF